MAHFAKLDENNVVTHVYTIAQGLMFDAHGDESEELGIQYCQQFFGPGTYVQTSYNGSFRRCYAGVGYTFNAERDVFFPPPPSEYPSWVFNEDLWQYTYPIPEPKVDRVLYRWDEPTVSWVLKTNPPPGAG